ncbi:hypothetical protein RchiOBHm_Chr1g0341281 [Rosa chinensis]|uniref:Uncharacterized protein n=1 Tax=Rosa chinensis TaxID=74649 RepID=A0A2P6SDQ1_ROSCH|nr:hypothetical protein RchiOBHm_Chr1g0341281 [Rosa chinensis]
MQRWAWAMGCIRIDIRTGWWAAQSFSGAWAWTVVLGLGYLILYFCCFLLLLGCGLTSVISIYHLVVGRNGLGPSLCTLCALFALGRR